MGEVAESVLAGFYCEVCCCIIDGEEPGYARICTDCFTTGLEVPKVHDLKCHPDFFEAVKSGAKAFEVRYNDRGYQVGDGLILKEYNPKNKKYSGRSLVVKVTYKTDFEQKPGYVVLGIQRYEMP